jgi:putative transcriptional regulator
MTSPRHHFPDEVLMEYVAGTSIEAVSLAIACHASLCPSCRRRIRWLEHLAGALVDSARPVALRHDALERALAQLDESQHARTPAAPRPASVALSFLPQPLWSYLPELRGGRLPFDSVVDGIGTIEFASITPKGGTARMVELAPSLTVPSHDHGGPEYGVLFAGGLREEDGREWHRGDVFYRLPGEVHVQEVLPGAACIALVVNEGSLIPLTPTGDVLKLFSA